MRAHCPRVAACRAQRETGWYCPCRVRQELADLVDLLGADDDALDRPLWHTPLPDEWTPGDGVARPRDGGRVRGRIPAHVLSEARIDRRADLTGALAWLCRASPAQGYAVAYAYGLLVEGGRVTFMGRRRADGTLALPPLGTVALLVNNRARWLLRAGGRGAAAAAPGLPRRALLRATIEGGIEALARRLGWRPGPAGGG